MVALALIGIHQLSTGTGDTGLLAAAGAYDQHGYNRTAREFKGTGESWCLARGRARDCFAEYGQSTFFMEWNAEWDRGVRDTWVLTPYNAEVRLVFDGKTYTVRWVGRCVDGESLPSGGTCVWGEYQAQYDTGEGVSNGLGGAWLQRAAPEKL